MPATAASNASLRLPREYPSLARGPPAHCILQILRDTSHPAPRSAPRVFSVEVNAHRKITKAQSWSLDNCLPVEKPIGTDWSKMDALNSAPQEVEIEIEDAAPTETQDRWFDQWVTAKGEPLKGLVSSMMGGLAEYERAAKTRKRQRKPEDKLRYETCVEVLVCNLAYAVLNPPTSGRIALRRGKRVQDHALRQSHS